jgi:malate dehydrogenase (oxaloacetate-decarboxylating)(NADP+)
MSKNRFKRNGMSVSERARKSKLLFHQEVLDYHRYPRPGKISLVPTKSLTDVYDLSLAYTPGIGIVCEEIVRDEMRSFAYTARGNLVGVITNGTAVLGLGDIGPSAAKPVMEGKSVLFKRFAGIDVFDIELNHKDPNMLVEIISAMEPTFGGINLEDIKAPECFLIEECLRRRLKIPVFHDDQHGTAIVVCAAILNALKLVDKEIGDIKIVVSGAGAAALACLDLLSRLGLPQEHIWVTDLAGVVYQGRLEQMDKYKARYAQCTSLRTLGEVIKGADVFLGLSASGVLTQNHVTDMAINPIILALANPVPEIMPEEVRAARPDAIIATGRSDYPNQVNNALVFPFIFRGALDVGAIAITEEMQTAAVYALAALARDENQYMSEFAPQASRPKFGRDYLIPSPFDPRLLDLVAPAVAMAAMSSGVASRPIHDWQEYRKQLKMLVNDPTS